MELTERFYEALAYAARLHAGQLRKAADVPYVAHLMRVCGTVMEFSDAEDDAIAALLHDAVEDQGGEATAEEIRRRFGDRVAGIVLDCSDTVVTPKPPWRERKDAYLARLRSGSASMRLIAAADKLDNVRSLHFEYRRQGEAVWSRFRGGRDGTLWYYRSVVEILKTDGNDLLTDELERAVRDFERMLQGGPGA